MKRALFALCFSIGLVGGLVVAAPVRAGDSVNVGNPLNSNFATGGTTERLGNTAVETVQNRLARLLSTMLRGIAALSLLPIVVGGFQMIISQGSEDKVARGKQTLYFGVVGLFLALIAIAFFQTMLSFLNFSS